MANRTTADANATVKLVADLTIAGKSANEIAAELQISQSGAYSARQRARRLGLLPATAITAVQPAESDQELPEVVQQQPRDVPRPPKAVPRPRVPAPAADPTTFAGRAAVFARLGAIEYLMRAGSTRDQAEAEVDRVGSMAAVAGRR